MIAVGIDISKAKSTVAVIDSDGTVLASPFTMAHTQPEMEAFVSYLKGLGEPTTILMEYTGHYHYPLSHDAHAATSPIVRVMCPSGAASATNNTPGRAVPAAMRSARACSTARLTLRRSSRAP